MTTEQLEKKLKLLERRICCSNSNVESGIYTPSTSLPDNLSSITPQEFQYLRVGDVVTVSGAFFVEPTLASNNSGFYFTVPIPSTMAGPGHAAGTLWGDPVANNGGQVAPSGVADTVTAYFLATDTGGLIFVHFTYLITDIPLP